MSKNIKVILGSIYLIILTTFLYFIFSEFDINRINDFSYYKELQINIEQLIGQNLYLNLIIFFIFSIDLGGFIRIWFSNSNFIWNNIWKMDWNFNIFNFNFCWILMFIYYWEIFFSDLIHQILKKKFNKFIERFQKNEFYYFLAFRAAGGLGIPFGLQNLLPVIFNIKNFNYFFASLFGFIPHFFIWNSVGAGINEYIKVSDEFSLLI